MGAETCAASLRQLMVDVNREARTGQSSKRSGYASDLIQAGRFQGTPPIPRDHKDGT
jgi:N-formylglutamate amidohydrolase